MTNLTPDLLSKVGPIRSLTDTQPPIDHEIYDDPLVWSSVSNYIGKYTVDGYSPHRLAQRLVAACWILTFRRIPYIYGDVLYLVIINIVLLFLFIYVIFILFYFYGL